MYINKIALLAISAAVLGGISTARATMIVSAASGLSSGTLYTFASPSFAANTAITAQYAGITFAPYLYYDGNGGTSNGGCAYLDMSTNCLTNFESDASNGGTAFANVATFSIFFTTPATAVSLALVTDGATDLFTLKNGSTVVDSMTVATPYANPGNYYGFSNEAPFTELDITTSGANLAVIGNLDVLSPASVPEPGTVGLLGIGMAGAVAFARRRTA